MDTAEILRDRLPGTKTGIWPSIFGQPTADNKKVLRSPSTRKVPNKSLMRERKPVKRQSELEFERDMVTFHVTRSAFIILHKF
jgi:hypothetical protein